MMNKIWSVVNHISTPILFTFFVFFFVSPCFAQKTNGDSKGKKTVATQNHDTSKEKGKSYKPSVKPLSTQTDIRKNINAQHSKSTSNETYSPQKLKTTSTTNRKYYEKPIKNISPKLSHKKSTLGRTNQKSLKTTGVKNNLKKVTSEKGYVPQLKTIAPKLKQSKNVISVNQSINIPNCDNKLTVTFFGPSDVLKFAKGDGEYCENQSISLTYNTPKGMFFNGWWDMEGNLISSENPYVIRRLTNSMNILPKLANADPSKTYIVSLHKSDFQNLAKFSCTGDINEASLVHTYKEKTDIKIVLLLDNSLSFDGWTENGKEIISKDNPFIIKSINRNWHLVANLSKKKLYNITLKQFPDKGYAFLKGNCTKCLAGQDYPIVVDNVHGDQIQFRGWWENGRVISTSKSYIVKSLSSNRNITAIFGKKGVAAVMPNPEKQYEVKLSAGKFNNQVTLYGEGNFESGSDDTLGIAFDSTLSFDGWYTKNGNKLISHAFSFPIKQIHNDWDIVAKLFPNVTNLLQTDKPIDTASLKNSGVHFLTLVQEPEKSADTLYGSGVYPNNGVANLGLDLKDSTLQFEGWYLNGKQMLSKDYSYTLRNINKDMRVVARFSKKKYYSIFLTPKPDIGLAELKGNFNSYLSGGDYPISAENINPDAQFKGWWENGRLLSMKNPYLIHNLNRDRKIVARFSVPQNVKNGNGEKIQRSDTLPQVAEKNNSEGNQHQNGNSKDALSTNSREYSIRLSQSPEGAADTLYGAGSYLSGGVAQLGVKFSDTSLQFDGWYVNGKVLLTKDYSYLLRHIIKNWNITAKFSKVKFFSINLSQYPSNIKVTLLGNYDHYKSGGDYKIEAENTDPQAQFNGWWENGQLLSLENPYTLHKLNRDRNIIAKYLVPKQLNDVGGNENVQDMAVDNTILPKQRKTNAKTINKPCQVSLFKSPSIGDNQFILKGNGMYDGGNEVTISAESPDNSVRFDGWWEHGQLISQNNPYNFVVKHNIKIEAHWTPVLNINIEMVHIDGGTFTMGNDDGPEEERPAHQVTLHGFELGKTEITQAQWRAVMGDAGPYFTDCDNCPVANMLWADAQTFVTKLSKATGLSYRLPTEAEWEYAAKGGVKTNGFRYAGGNNLDDVAYYRNNSDSSTHPVAEKQPNELGLYDMTGNVWEYCADYYAKGYAMEAQSNPTGPKVGLYRVIKGGGFFSGDYITTSTRRADKHFNKSLSFNPKAGASDVGFRVALTAQ